MYEWLKSMKSCVRACALSFQIGFCALPCCMEITAVCCCCVGAFTFNIFNIVLHFTDMETTYRWYRSLCCQRDAIVVCDYCNEEAKQP